MNTRVSRKSALEESIVEEQAPLGLFTNAYQQKMALFSEAASALLRSAAAVQEIQQRAVQQFTERLQSGAHSPDENFSAADLLSTQSRYWSIDQDLVKDYWRDMTSALLQAQSDLSNCATSLLKEQSIGPLKAFADTWQNLVAKSLNISNDSAN